MSLLLSFPMLILGSFFYTGKTKQIRSFFFFKFLSLISFLIWGFGKNYLEGGASLQYLRFPLGHSGAPPLRKKGTSVASLNMEFKWLLFFIFTELPQTGYCLLEEWVLDGSLPEPVQVMWNDPAYGGEKKGNSHEWLLPHPISCIPKSCADPLKERGRRIFFIPYSLAPTRTCQAMTGLVSHL